MSNCKRCGRPERHCVDSVVCELVKTQRERNILRTQRDELLSLAREYRALHVRSLVLGKDCSCSACARADAIIAKAVAKP